MEGFQLWLNLPGRDKLQPPWYRDFPNAELPQFVTPQGVAVTVIAGPCAVESEEQLLAGARVVKRHGADLLRGGAYKPRSSPYSFQGLGKEGLRLLDLARAETALPVISEAVDEASLALVEVYADVIQIGARSMRNYSLLRRAGRSPRPVFLKRAMSATLEDLMLSAEYVLGDGNSAVILCERGIRTFSDHSRFTLDLSVVPAAKERCHLPFFVDPSHATGLRSRVPAMALAAVAAGADALGRPTTNHRTNDVMPEPCQNPSPLQTQKGQALSVGPLAAVIEAIRRQQAEKGGSHSILAEVFDEVGTDTNARIDLDKLKQVAEAARQWHGHIGLDEDQFERDSSRFARLLLPYNKAYFGDLSYRARSGSTGTGPRGVLKVTSQGFVDRSGNAFLFPGISAEIEMSSASPVRATASLADSQRVSADLTRIFLEAFFDTAFRVPAVHGATALRVAPSSQESSYPEFDADHPAIPVEPLARVTRGSLRAEAAVVSIVGKTVRGGSVLGTQNETLAATLETAAGVIAKKLVALVSRDGAGRG